MPRSVNKTISGWGNYPQAGCHLFRPHRQSDLAHVFEDQVQKNFIPRGLGRSYGDASLNQDQGVILLTQLDRFMTFDEQTGVVECESGVSIGTIIDVFLPRGFFPVVTPGTQFVTVGGAIAADIHGKNHHRDGSMAECVLGFTLLIPTGEILTCSREKNEDLFWATIGGMGLTGVIVTARLQLRRVESGYLRVIYQQAEHVDQLLAHFDFHNQDDSYSVAWIDCLATGASLGRGVLMLADHAQCDDLPVHARLQPLQPRRRRRQSVPFFMPGAVLNPMTVRRFNALYYRRHASCEKLVDYETFFFPLDRIHHWNRIYGKRGFVQYQVVLPSDGGHDGIKRLLERIASSGAASFLAVLKKLGRPSGGLLSFPRDGYTLSLDLPNTGSQLLDLVGALDRIVLDQGGRLYLAKDACLDRSSFERMYPELDHFRQVKARLDPDIRLSSSLARRLGIVDYS